jgi:hypothetical protein
VAVIDDDTVIPSGEPGCPICDGTGIERSGVCYCGADMDGHSLFDNHCATEMTRQCECVKQEAPRG